MALKIGQQARKARGLLAEDPVAATEASDVPAPKKSDLDDLNVTLMGVEVTGKEGRLIEITLKDGKVASVVKGKIVTANDAKYQFKIESARKILSTANNGSK